MVRKQPLRNMKPVVGTNADQVCVEGGVMNFRERDSIWHDGDSVSTDCIFFEVSPILPDNRT